MRTYLNNNLWIYSYYFVGKLTNKQLIKNLLTPNHNFIQYACGEKYLNFIRDFRFINRFLITNNY